MTAPSYYCPDCKQTSKAQMWCDKCGFNGPLKRVEQKEPSK